MVNIEGPGAAKNHLKQSCCFLGVNGKPSKPSIFINQWANGNFGTSMMTENDNPIATESWPRGSAKVIEALFPADGHFLLAPEAGRPWFQPWRWRCSVDPWLGTGVDQNRMGGMKVWLNQAAALMWEPGDSGFFIHTQIILQDLNPSFTGTTSTSPQDVCCEV